MIIRVRSAYKSALDQGLSNVLLTNSYTPWSIGLERIAVTFHCDNGKIRRHFLAHIRDERQASFTASGEARWFIGQDSNDWCRH
ncbi:TPA: hypothetical protein L6A41_31830 [Pseudomonas aeruginosa]|nr:hypothetical protein APB53_05930 [Pseudomonas aeruginosa]RPV08536.1 hypothetical protein IPC880_09345 [Pseudomonas aeruginosa]HBP5602934.1 hypothetical protein [Pseudomonas aeruginosa]HBP5649106.1 hypothetical protein [Pseudomonas aeruginosa]HBP5921101.1 hypothetical protein [Pseudomonas aeruginosa]